MSENRIWIPTLGNHCGISEYTIYLNHHLKAQLIKNIYTYGPLKNGLLHIQHEYGYFDAPGRLAAYLYKTCSEYSVPYFITEHAVDSKLEPEAFELYPNAIVVHTQAQYEVVSKRTKTPVVLIPHGTFDRGLSPKKRGTTQIIGAFGFMNETKGFDKILDFLDVHPDYSLLLFSSSVVNGIFQRKMAKRIRRMSQVTWISEFLPEYVVAERLMREADILVYWYSPPQHLSASGAVNFGLSTGVPVIGSRTPWFSGLPVLTPIDMAEGIHRLMGDPKLYEHFSEAQLEYCKKNKWSNSASQHRELWGSYAY